MNDDYEDIINLPRPQSRNHKPMPMINRAAQFAPFSALNGHEEALQSRRDKNTSNWLHSIPMEQQGLHKR
jgi:hypothetical protein